MSIIHRLLRPRTLNLIAVVLGVLLLLDFAAGFMFVGGSRDAMLGVLYAMVTLVVLLLIVMMLRSIMERQNVGVSLNKEPKLPFTWMQVWVGALVTGLFVIAGVLAGAGIYGFIAGFPLTGAVNLVIAALAVFGMKRCVPLIDRAFPNS